ncbi:MAG: hypothetical protein BroJett024_40900 [Alphaproteobacteria bacterium]|nr:MAG: hypothetical protein BroJett024_40900 [Alphaproteobacteria bacterium]
MDAFRENGAANPKSVVMVYRRSAPHPLPAGQSGVSYRAVRGQLPLSIDRCTERDVETGRGSAQIKHEDGGGRNMDVQTYRTDLVSQNRHCPEASGREARRAPLA